MAGDHDGDAGPRRPRRRLLLATVGALVLVGAVVAGFIVFWPQGPDVLPGPEPVFPPVTGAVIRVAPDGTGAGDTDSWSDAAPLRQLPRILAKAEPGTQVWLRADAGPYLVNRPIPMRGGGTADAPIVIRGVDSDGEPQAANIVGDRVDPYDPAGAKGNEVFRLLGGANHLVFQELDFRNVGNGAFRIGADITGLTIRQITATNVRRFIENNASGETPTATISGLTVTNVTVEGYSRGVARLQYDSNRILFDGVRGDSEGQDLDPFAVGIHLSGTVHDVDIRNTSMLNSVSTKRDYWNGDGFTAEKMTHDIRFDNTYSAGHTDAGYDLKSRSAILTRAVAADSKRNFRFFGNITVDGCTGIDPHLRGGTGTQTQVHATSAAVVSMTRCTFEDSDAQTIVFDVDGTARFTVTDSTVVHAPDAQLKTVEPGGHLEQAATVKVN